MICKDNQHKRRDNKFGVTWCIRCGRLFTKPCGKLLNLNEIKVIKHNLL